MLLVQPYVQRVWAWALLLSVSLILVPAVAPNLCCCTKGCSSINRGFMGGSVKWDCGTSPGFWVHGRVSEVGLRLLPRGLTQRLSQRSCLPS